MDAGECTNRKIAHPPAQALMSVLSDVAFLPATGRNSVAGLRLPPAALTQSIDTKIRLSARVLPINLPKDLAHAASIGLVSGMVRLPLLP